MRSPLLLMLVALAAGCRRPPPEPDLPIDAGKRAWLIDQSLQRIGANYLFPEVGARVIAAVRARQQRGEYDRVTSATAFTELLSAHFYEVAHDRHLSVRFSAAPLAPRSPPGPDPAETVSARFANHGFVRAERLDGNIGYLRLDRFGPPDTVGEVAGAALAFVAHTDALIIDLRENTGGYGPTVDLLETLVEAGPRRPTFLLTSPRTISGGEAFAYDLQAAKRVTVVGERTAGAAHFGPIYSLDEHFEMQIAVAQPINPITGTNWEGTGVVPDVAVTAGQALARALVLALEGRTDQSTDPEQREEVQEALREARATLAH